MGEWPVVKLDEVASLGGGFAFKSAQYTENGRFVLRTVNITDDFSITRDGATYISEAEAADYERFALKPNDSLFVMVAATLGKVGLVRERDLPALLNQNMWVVRARAGKIDPVFLHYLFRELSKIPIAWVSGSARSFLRRDDVRNLKFRLPPESVQIQIGKLLSALDDKIELNRMMNEKLEASAQALFRDWFVDFGPTRAKMEGRPAYLAPDLWRLFPDRLDAECRPEGWAIESIYKFADVVYGAPFASDRFNRDGIGRPMARIRDLSSHEAGQFTDEVHKKEFIIQPGYIVVGMDGEFRAHIWHGVPTLMNQRICAFVPKEQYNRGFVWQAIEPLLATQESTAIGTTVIHLGKKDIDRFIAISPGSDLLQAFGKLVEPLIDVKVRNGIESTYLSETRDLLLPKLMTGEIRVRDAEKMVGDNL